MSLSKQYKVSNQRQLIDLNGQSINFDLNFNVESVNGEEFEILVVDQTTLDSNNNLQYKKVTEGQMSGNVKSDKNIYQNYFLILKSDKDCDVIVNIMKTDLPLRQEENLQQQQLQQQQLQQQQLQQQQLQQQQLQQQNNPKSNFKLYIIVFGIILVIGIGYYFYKNSQNNSKEDSKELSNTELTNNVYSSPVNSVKSKNSSNNLSPINSQNIGYNNELLERLNKLQI
jgi:hypothetical protein